MKILGLTTAVVGIGIAIGVASPASAQPTTTQMDPTTVKMVCGKHGGLYGPPGAESGGAVCLYPDGAFTNCDKNNNCTHYPAASRVNATTPIKPSGDGQVG